MLVEKEVKIQEQEESISSLKLRNSVNERRIKELENEVKALKGKGRPSKDLKMSKHKSQHQNRRGLFGGGSSDKDSDDGLDDQDEARDSDDEREQERQGLAMSMGVRGQE